MGCCKIVLFILNLHGLFSACDFSHRNVPSVSKTWPPHLGHFPIGCCPVKSIFTTGSCGPDDFLADFFPFAGLGSNSKPTFPSCNTRKALNGRPFFEMNLSSRSVFPTVKSFCAWGHSMCC